jgi:AcrR family transcriptional regulator
MADGSIASGAEKPLGVRAAGKAANRARILAAARAAFEARGYAGADIRSIAGAAGLSIGAVFSNFDSKDALYRDATGRPAPAGQLAEAAPDLVFSLLAAHAFIEPLKGPGVAELLFDMRAALAKAGFAP